MADRSLEARLIKAENAYQKGDKRKGARLVEDILRHDFNHLGAWELLHRTYGSGSTIEEFRRSFAERYFPERLGELDGYSDLPISRSTGKPSIIDQLFRSLRGSRFENAPVTESGVPNKTGDIEFNQEELKLDPSAHSPLREPLPFQSHNGLAFSVEPDPFKAENSSRSADPRSPHQIPAIKLTHTWDENQLLVETIHPMEKIRVVLADDIAETREIVFRSLKFQEGIEVVGTAMNGLQAIQLVRQLKPDVVLMDVNMPDMDGIAATATIKRDQPVTEVVILTVQDDLDYMRRAMLAGARDFLTKPPKIDELIKAILRAGAQARQNRMRQPPIPFPTESFTPASGGRIITVYSPRGGSGCTLLSANLALSLQRDDSAVVLIDGDLHYGDLPVFMNTQSKNSILDLSPRVNELDPDMVNEVLVTHPSGVKVLHSPRLERSQLVTGPHFFQLLNYLSNMYGYVIVDTSHRLNETTLAALDASTLIVLVSTLDIPSISRVQKFLELAPLLNIDLDRISLVINQFDTRLGILPERLPQAFGREPVAIIPLEFATAIESINRSLPILAKRETAQEPIGLAIMKFAAHIQTRLEELEITDLQNM